MQSYVFEHDQVEIKLKKMEGWRWEKLENDGTANTPKQFNPGKLQLICFLLLLFLSSGSPQIEQVTLSSFTFIIVLF